MPRRLRKVKMDGQRTGVMSVMGFDPALRHGALIMCHWDVLDGTIIGLRAYDEVFVWDDKSENSLGVKSDIEEIYSLSVAIREGLTSHNGHGLPVAIDWDGKTVYWKARRDQAVNLAFFMGVMRTIFDLYGCLPFYLSPRSIRAAMGLRQQEPKLGVWQQFKKILPDLRTTSTEIHETNADVVDAVILSYVLSTSMLNQGASVNSYE